MNFQSYQSPFSWRYGSDRMREIWSIQAARLRWREIWAALAEVEADFGLVSADQVRVLKEKVDQVDLERSLMFEETLQHDLAAELEAYGEQCPEAKGILHLGATSMDIKDNALILQQKEALSLILSRSSELLILLAGSIRVWAQTPILGYTHLQPAEPTTLGYRLALPAQDLFSFHQELERFQAGVKAKGFTGAVGTSASFAALLGEENLAAFQEKISKRLGLDFQLVVSQTYSRLQDYLLLSLLAGQGAAIYKMAFDLRLLQAAPFGELAEPFGKEQVGSSAMPFKQNPIRAEKINSLGRLLAQFPRTAWDNGAHSLLERTLDDSANMRVIIPEAFLCLDEMLVVMAEILDGLQVHEKRIQRNLTEYAPFTATEHLLMQLSKKGADRQEMHQILRGLAAQAWNEVNAGNPNPLISLAVEEEAFLVYMTGSEVQEALMVDSYLGDAPSRAERLAEQILSHLK